MAFASVLLLGFTALVIDIGMGFNERRHDQTAADVAVMAGALEFADDADIVDKVMANATANGIDVAGLGRMHRPRIVRRASPRWRAKSASRWLGSSTVRWHVPASPAA